MLEEPQAFQAFLFRLQDLPVVNPIRQKADDLQQLNFPLPKARFETPTSSAAGVTQSGMAAGQSPDLTVSVKAMKVGYMYTLTVDPLATIGQLKQQLAAQCSISPDYQRLLIKGKALQDSSLVTDYGLDSDVVITLMVKPGAPTPITPASAAPKPTKQDQSDADQLLTSTTASPTTTPRPRSTPSNTGPKLPQLSAETRAKLAQSGFQTQFQELLSSQGISTTDQTLLLQALSHF
ncbi:hypothetical protein H4R33_006903 [Dimargaris cristalligena]|uniref:Ubiquitin-like domain-containing protein n=1 Tax=Dimargaris cristalligena TaxID=215637 RepID=A0A4P9ZTQ9_9FUNG|nr:hypothetical protein H4R33_006903 [Dimargaris cristalligena]RKP36877.1 hypothetical protein BJ085DRAFT_39701 [Dimargaris cristalligena]|eukprot:RKP36877.1 hypothetical protein BJ085DRAFT_39701 [Dimargaris cristalligena]